MSGLKLNSMKVTLSSRQPGAISLPLYKHFLSTDGLCQHVVSVAEKMRRLAEILTHYREKKNKASKVMFKKVPTSAGEKPSSKRRKERNNVKARPIIEKEDPHDLSHQKAPRCNEHYHNDEPFHVVFAKNHPQAVQCISCDIGFSRRMPIVRPCLCTQGTLGIPC